MEILFYIVFFATALLLILVILLQEGKGGGLSDAFGGAGAETFGVRAGGINKFTFGLFAVFVLSAMALHWASSDPLADSVMRGISDAPAEEMAPSGGTGGTGVPGGGAGGANN